MERRDFNAILRAAHEHEADLLAEKAQDYAPGRDPLANFRASAALQRITPEKALMGMLAKHLVSVADLVNGVEEPPCPHGGGMCGCPSWEPVSMDTWVEKLHDARAYLVLLEALVRERLGAYDHEEERPDGLGAP